MLLTAVTLLNISDSVPVAACRGRAGEVGEEEEWMEGWRWRHLSADKQACEQTGRGAREHAHLPPAAASKLHSDIRVSSQMGRRAQDTGLFAYGWVAVRRLGSCSMGFHEGGREGGREYTSSTSGMIGVAQLPLVNER